MLRILMTAVNAVCPIVLLILLGYFLRQKGLVNDAFVKCGSSLVFKILLPALMFINVYDIGDLAQVEWNAVIFCVAAVTALFLLGIPGQLAVLLWFRMYRMSAKEDKHG